MLLAILHAFSLGFAGKPEMAKDAVGSPEAFCQAGQCIQICVHGSNIMEFIFGGADLLCSVHSKHVRLIATRHLSVIAWKQPKFSFAPTAVLICHDQHQSSL